MRTKISVDTLVKDIYTLEEVAILLQMNPLTLKRHAEAGRVKCISTDGKHRKFRFFTKNALIRWFNILGILTGIRDIMYIGKTTDIARIMPVVSALSDKARQGDIGWSNPEYMTAFADVVNAVAAGNVSNVCMFENGLGTDAKHIFDALCMIMGTRIIVAPEGFGVTRAGEANVNNGK